MKKKNSMIVLCVLLGFTFCLRNVKKEYLAYTSANGAVQNQITKTKAFLTAYAELNDNFTKRLWKYANKECNIEKSKKIEIYIAPFYELKTDSLYCYWNFRKELITFSIQNPVQIPSISSLYVNFYKDSPSGITWNFRDKDWSVERNIQWKFSFTRKSSLLAKVQFQNVKNGHRIAYHFHRETGDFLRKEEVRKEDGKEILDGWQFLIGYFKHPEVCEYYEKGTLMSEKTDCQLLETTPTNLELETLPPLPDYDRSRFELW